MESQNALPMQPNGLPSESGMLEALPRDMRASGQDDTASQEASVYVVQMGDTYEDIAQGLGITVSQLFERNPFLDPNRMEAGQTLRVPQALTRMDWEALSFQVLDSNEGSTDESVPEIGMTPAQPRLEAEAEPESVSIWECPADHVWIVLPSSWDVVSVLRYYNISYQALAESNPQMDLETMEAGQNLCIPPSGSRGQCSVGLRCYIMGEEDTLDTLSDASGYSVWEILRMNPCLAPNDFVNGCTVCLPTD